MNLIIYSSAGTIEYALGAEDHMVCKRQMAKKQADAMQNVARVQRSRPTWERGPASGPKTVFYSLKQRPQLICSLEGRAFVIVQPTL
jgi:hypothetical protein